MEENKMNEEKKDKPVFEFKKLAGGKCQFIMKSKDIERVETVSEKYAKDHYNELINQRTQLYEQMKMVNKDLEVNKVDKDIELENFINLVNNAAKYSKFMKAQDNQKGVLDMIDNVNESIKKIEIVYPELTRKKK
jgi:hypothetical protein